jgi:hypothetical protein
MIKTKFGFDAWLAAAATPIKSKINNWPVVIVEANAKTYIHML